MGVVYRATQRFPRRAVALKVLAPDLAHSEGFGDRFERECQMAAEIEHPNIIPIYEAGEVDGLLFIAMRLVEGIDLRTRIDRDGPLDPRKAISIVGQVGTALHAAHAHGLVHRDVKPANVLLASGHDESDLEHAYLTDFGVAKQTRSQAGLTRTGLFVGTVDYAAPEQIEGRQLDGRADIYALGCVFYECLVGAAPFKRGADVAVLFAHLNDDPPRVSEVCTYLPPAVDDVIRKAMAKSRDDRYQTMRDFVSSARAALEGVSAQAGRSLPSAATVIDERDAVDEIDGARPLDLPRVEQQRPPEDVGTDLRTAELSSADVRTEDGPHAALAPSEPTSSLRSEDELTAPSVGDVVGASPAEQAIEGGGAVAETTTTPTETDADASGEHARIPPAEPTRIESAGPPLDAAAAPGGTMADPPRTVDDPGSVAESELTVGLPTESRQPGTAASVSGPAQPPPPGRPARPPTRLPHWRKPVLLVLAVAVLGAIGAVIAIVTSGGSDQPPPTVAISTAQSISSTQPSTSTPTDTTDTAAEESETEEQEPSLTPAQQQLVQVAQTRPSSKQCKPIADARLAGNATVGIRCGTEGSVKADYFRFDTVAATNAYYESIRKKVKVTEDKGTCGTTGASAENEWSVNSTGDRGGRLLCYETSASPRIVWTDEKSRVLTIAYRTNTDQIGPLVSWWESAGVAQAVDPAPDTSTSDTSDGGDSGSSTTPTETTSSICSDPNVDPILKEREGC